MGRANGSSNNDKGLMIKMSTMPIHVYCKPLKYVSSTEPVDQLDFSESFVACDLKVGRYRHFIVLMQLCEYSRSSSFLDLAQRSFTL